MSVALHLLLEAEPCLEGEVADGTADPLTSHHLGQAGLSEEVLKVVWVFNFFWVGRTSEQAAGAEGEGYKREGDQEEVDHYALFEDQAVLRLLLIPPLPLHLFLLLHLLHIILILLLLLLCLLQEV